MSAISVSALNTALGAYFRKDKDILISEMLMGMNIDDRFEIMDDVKDEVPMPSLDVADLVKPADAVNFTPTSNALVFGARIGKVRGWKVDLQLVPATLEKTWLGSRKKKGSNAYDLPFEEFILKYITDRVHENLRMKALFKGVYNGSGTAPADIFNGLNTLLAAEITAGTVTATVTGAITSANVIDKLELVYDSLGEAYKEMETEMPVAPQIFTWYVRKYRALYGPNADYTGMPQGKLKLDGTNCTVMREPGLGTSQRVHVTPKANRVYMVDSLDDSSSIDSQVFDRTIKLFIDAKGGVQFKQVNDRCMAVNDQA